MKENIAFIPGGAGFIGSNLTRRLLDEGFVVHAADNFITGRRENIDPFLNHPSYRFFEVDIVDRACAEAVKDVPFTHIFLLACPTGVPNIERLSREMLQTSSIGTQNVLEIARTTGARMLFTSSCEVYGSPLVFPQHEEYAGNVDARGARGPYEEGKRFSEALITMYVRRYNVNARIVRIFNTYGPGMSLADHRVIPQFLSAIKNGMPLRVYGDGGQKRTFLYVDDLVEGLLVAMERGVSGEVYNVGGDTQVTVSELAALLLRVAGSSCSIEFHPHFIEDHPARLPLLEKIHALGWKQTVSLEEGLKRMMESYHIACVPPTPVLSSV